METTYTLRAADGKEYGPVTLVQVVAWVHEGRVADGTELRRSDMQHWAAARDFKELQFLFGASQSESVAGTPQTSAPPPGAHQVAALVAQMKSGASWFYWIAALSLLNSLCAAFKTDLQFVLGLGITRIIDSHGAEIGGAGKLVMLALAVGAALILVLFGVLGCRRHLWAFIVGIGLYILDGILFVLAERWIEVAFHGLAIFFLFRGLQACRQLRP